jgi:uncharacterized membrane protein YphA (DoxX/SURF4 family)
VKLTAEAHTMKARTIGYWVSTALIALGFLVGGSFDVMATPEAIAGLKELGYPAYLAVILGAWKILGALVIVAPGLPRLKEWAYAGILFDLTGAAASHGYSGDPAPKVIIPLVMAAIMFASWWLRPASRKLGVLPFERAA